MALAKAKEIVSSNKVVIFSERLDPYSVCVKQLFAVKLWVPYKAIELNEESDGREIQCALADWTGQRALPSVFIGGKHIGNCDKTWALHKKGKLVPLLAEVQIVVPLHRLVTPLPRITKSPQDEFARPTNRKRSRSKLE
ncbi:hypothetical protein M0R45_013665 [Rubus argutus]|uniref:Glutaredoxin domain-containing protein n=1 Tax=Rubus argutus TaxID=59490 RepID=A0AAW1XMJ6_RUBAR